jgi:hypothetical protein
MIVSPIQSQTRACNVLRFRFRFPDVNTTANFPLRVHCCCPSPLRSDETVVIDDGADTESKLEPCITNVFPAPVGSVSQYALQILLLARPTRY